MKYFSENTVFQNHMKASDFMGKFSWKRLLPLVLTLALMIQLLPPDIFAAQNRETATMFLDGIASKEVFS